MMISVKTKRRNRLLCLGGFLLACLFLVSCNTDKAPTSEDTTLLTDTTAETQAEINLDTEGITVMEKGFEIPSAGLNFRSVRIFRDTYEAYLKNAAPSDFDTYVEVLRALGYRERTAPNTVGDGGARYAVYENEEQVLYVRYFPSVVYQTSVNTTGSLEKQAAAGVTVKDEEHPIYPSYLRVSYEKPEKALPLSSEQAEFVPVCQPKGYLLSVSPYFENGDENGMMMFYLLSDGTFLIYDSGAHEEDADYLYTCLNRVAQENNIDEIVISAWVVTHCHPDHMSGVVPFFEKYGNEVTVRQMLYNPELENQANSFTVFNGVPDSVPQYRLHFGQSFYLADLKIDILYTPEDYVTIGGNQIKLGYIANTTDNGNKASVVMRLTFPNRQTVLMTGDCHFESWDFLCSVIGSELKADCLQVAHHGVHHGMTQISMDFIAPDYLVYPCGDTMMENILSGNFPYSGCQRLALYLREHYGKKGIYVAGGLYTAKGISRITQFFPLTEQTDSAT